MQVLKVGMPDVKFKSFAPQGEAQSCEVSSQLQVAVPRVGFMVKLSLGLSYLFWCGFFFLVCQMCGSSSSGLGFLLEEIVLCVAVDALCLQEEVMSSGFLYVAILN